MNTFSYPKFKFKICDKIVSPESVNGKKYFISYLLFYCEIHSNQYIILIPVRRERLNLPTRGRFPVVFLVRIWSQGHTMDLLLEYVFSRRVLLDKIPARGPHPHESNPTLVTGRLRV